MLYSNSEMMQTDERMLKIFNNDRNKMHEYILKYAQKLNYEYDEDDHQKPHF